MQYERQSVLYIHITQSKQINFRSKPCKVPMQKFLDCNQIYGCGLYRKIFHIAFENRGRDTSLSLLVKRLGQKDPSNCLINRQETQYFFSWRSQFSILCSGRCVRMLVVSSETCALRTMNLSLSHSGCRPRLKAISFIKQLVVQVYHTVRQYCVYRDGHGFPLVVYIRKSEIIL